MKRTISILLTVCMLLSLCACGRKRKDETYLMKIGVLEPMSGKYSEQGKRETLGIQYANASTPTVELGGKTYRVELVLKDNGSDAIQSEKAAQELVNAGCAIVLGSYSALLSNAASDVFRDAGLPAIAANCEDDSVTKGNDHYFRICALPELQGAALARFAKKSLYAKSAYCLAEIGSEEDEKLVRAFCRVAEALSIRVVTTAFPPNTVDFTPYLNAAEEEDVSVIFAPCALRYAELLVEQSDPKGGTAPMLADARWADGALLAALEEKQLPVYVSAAYAEGADAAFDAAFKAWLNDNSEALTLNGGNDAVSPESALGYDAYFTALAAAKAAKSADKADILAILPIIARTGVTGEYSFDEDGGAVRSALWVEKANAKTQKWEFVTAVRAEG